jgi:hypothetical protein
MLTGIDAVQRHRAARRLDERRQHLNRRGLAETFRPRNAKISPSGTSNEM